MKRGSKKLKMFVWEGAGVLQDYSTGLICVLAHDVEEALELIEKKYDYAMESFPHDEYKVIEEPEAFLVYGGG